MNTVQDAPVSFIGGWCYCMFKIADLCHCIILVVSTDIQIDIS
jgi:hypothetical protein